MASELKNPPAELANVVDVMSSSRMELTVRDVTYLAYPNIDAITGERTRAILRSVSRADE